MIKISDDVRDTLLTDSTTKTLTIEGKGFDITKWNFCTQASSTAGSLNVPKDPDYGGESIEELKGSSGEIIESDAVLDTYSYGYLSFMLCFTNVTSYPETARIILYEFDAEYGWMDYSNPIAQKTINISEYIAESSDDAKLFFVPFETASLHRTNKYRAAIYNDSDTNITCSFYALHPMLSFGDDVSEFPYSYVNPTTQDEWQDSLIDKAPFTINNDHLLSESFSLSESLCSEQNVKFGLCEAAYCQFTVTDFNQDFREREIRPSINVQSNITEHEALKKINLFAWEGSDSTRNWPQPGTPLNSSWGGASYNASKNFTGKFYCGISDDAKQYLSEYGFLSLKFRAKFTEFTVVDETQPRPAKVIFASRESVKFDDGTIKDTYWTLSSVDGVKYQTFNGVNTIVPVSEMINDFVNISLKVPVEFSEFFSDWFVYEQHIALDNFAYYNNSGSVVFMFLDENDNKYSSNLSAIKMSLQIRDVQVNFVDSINENVPEYNQYDAIEFYGSTIKDYLQQFSGNIPLGVFTVDSIKKNYVNDIVKQEITAYDKLTLLEQNAADWYTQYMFGIDFMTDDVRHGFTFARQIFSTYYNFIKTTGIDMLTDKDYPEDLLWSESYSLASDTPNGTPMVEWRLTDTTEQGTDWNGNSYIGHKDSNINYVSHTESDPDVNKLYRVCVTVDDDKYGKISTIKERLPYYTEYFDPLFRGLDVGNVLVQQTRSNGTTFGICVDSNDYFMLDPDCVSMTIFAPTSIQESRNYIYTGWATYVYNFTYVVQLFATREKVAPDLSNGHTRLLYYNYGNKEIFDCDSTITGRDVVRSLLEPNGCFYRLNRFTGRPEFIYCNKSGLYPSDTLYPRNELYPRMGPNEIITRDQYQSFIQEDYTVQKFGKIQILKNITSNQTKSVVEWEYTGDSKYKNSYLIEDNIFYCNEKMEYDYDNMPEVAEMLQNMWSRISNMDYTPCTLVSKGMPWVECGDRVTALTKYGGAESFVFHRTLKGIQSLTDTFESEGDEYNKEVKDYGYKIVEG